MLGTVRLSFVVQGPIVESEAGSTRATCAAIRHFFPGSEIVLSTWAGSNIAGISHDACVMSPDPGKVEFDFNTNRMIVSSLAGVRQARGALVVRLRSDLLFQGDGVLRFWDRWRDVGPSYRLFQSRVLIPNVFTRKPSHLSPLPMNPSDWCFLGRREDLLLLFDVPALTPGEAAHTPPASEFAGLFWNRGRAPRYSVEQWLWSSAIRKIDPALPFSFLWDFTPVTLTATEASFANNFVVLDTAEQYGLVCPKYPEAGRTFQDETLYHHAEWLELCGYYGGGRDAARPVRSLAEIVGEPEWLPSWTLRDHRIVELRQAGYRWEAQLIESMLAGPTLLRDFSTGGSPTHPDAMRARDLVLVTMARRELLARLAATGPA
jgi:hypothetical protein